VLQADSAADLPIMVTEYNVHTNYEWDMRASTVDTPWEVSAPVWVLALSSSLILTSGVIVRYQSFGCNRFSWPC
jgi:hypothetical protein